MLLDGFRKTIEECNLIELDLMGGKYTWEKSRGKKEWVRERIDRAFATAAWWQIFPLCNLNVFHTIYSDHEPIQVEFYSTQNSRKKFRFRFENTWLKEKVFHEEVSNYWRSLSPVNFLPKLLELSDFMGKWGKRFFNKFREKIQKQKDIPCLFEDCADEYQMKRYFEKKGKLEELLMQEEIYWKQRAKSFWLMEGDTNSRFFHAYATTRKKKNSINHLVDDNGVVVTEHEGMCRVVEEYFVKLFSQDDMPREENFLSYDTVISEMDNTKLVKEFTFEFSVAVNQMHQIRVQGQMALIQPFIRIFGSCWVKKCFNVVKGGCKK